MRLLALDLRSYGPFAHAPVLDLSGGDRGLHLIVGPNEAGKSTALRAIRALLFDYPRTTPDDHGRDAATLRVGGTLRGEAGAEVAFLRRKRGKRFWTPDDRSSLADDLLAPVLDGLDEATFAELFSTDHAELVEGGRAILRGGGKLGEMLFAAGSGLAQLDRVRLGLQSEMDELFKAGGTAKNPKINKGLLELKAAREEVRRDALPTAEWVEADAALARAAARRSEVARRRHEAQAALDRERGWLGALRVIPRRREVLDRIEARPSHSILRAGFAEAYQAEAEAARAAARSAAEARDARLAAEAELAEAGDLDPALGEADAIGRLHADLGRYTQARRDRPARAAQLARAEALVRDRLDALPAGVALPAGPLGPVREPIQELAQRRAALAQGRRDAEAELARLAADDVEDDAAEAPGASAALDAALARAAAAGDLDARRAEARARLAAVEAEAAASARSLALWSGSLADLEALAIPPDATFDRADAEIRAADERIREAEAQRVDLEGRLLDLDRDAERARLAGPAPTLADLDAARAARDADWLAIRATWINAEPGAGDARILDDYEGRCRAADELADRLRREADRVADDARREVDRRDLRDRLKMWAETRARAEAARRAALDRWADLWRPLGVAPLPPREMRDWARVDRRDRLRLAQAAREARAEADALDARADLLRAELGHALGRVGEPPADPGESLAALRDRGRIAVDRIGARARRAQARGRLAEVAAREADWLGRWRDAVAPIGLGPDTPPTTALTALEGLAEWADATREAGRHRDALADLDAIEARFAAEAAALDRRLGAGAPDGPVADWGPAAARLRDRLADAEKRKARRDAALARLDAERARLDRAESAAHRAAGALAALAAEAGCATPGDLPDAIRRSAEAEADRVALRELDEQLDGFAGAATREELLAAVAGLDAAALAARIAEGADAVAGLDAELAGLDQEIGGARERLAAMDGRKGAAEAHQAAHDVAARVEAEMERYARLRLASAVLREAIERHRARHQGPVLERAGDLFARLTAGSFAGLQADRDDAGNPVLRGVRGRPAAASEVEAEGDEAAPAPAAAVLDVEAMSAGTADQLSLALRLASLSVHLDDNPPAPFVVDDILAQSDDERARAALVALAELSRRTQVLFFTHHEHLAEIARAAVPAADLFVHRLDARIRGVPEADAAPARGRRKRPAAADAGKTG